MPGLDGVESRAETILTMHGIAEKLAAHNRFARANHSGRKTGAELEPVNGTRSQPFNYSDQECLLARRKFRRLRHLARRLAAFEVLGGVSHETFRGVWRVTARAPHSAETRACIRSRLQAFWANPENRIRQSEITKVRMALPGVSERIAERTAAALADPIVKRRHVEGLKARFADPVLREKISKNTKAGMQRWRAGRLEAAAVVLRQLPRADREAAMAELASAALGASKR